MIKLVIFDLDGVLYESKEFHFDALNQALSEVDSSLEISKEEHLKSYDGLSTNKKLDIQIFKTFSMQQFLQYL